MSSLNAALPGIALGDPRRPDPAGLITDTYSLVFASLLLPAEAVG